MAQTTKHGCNKHDTMRTGQSPVEIQQTILDHLHYTQAKLLPFARRINFRCQAGESTSPSLFKEPHYEHAPC